VVLPIGSALTSAFIQASSSDEQLVSDTKPKVGNMKSIDAAAGGMTNTAS
jgi:hypothetical protein